MQIDHAIDALQEQEDSISYSSGGPYFALDLGLVEINTPIDYSTRIGADLNESMFSLLPLKFNGEEDTLAVFTDALMDRSREMKWDSPDTSILDVPVFRNGRKVHMNLIEKFGEYTLQELKDQVLTYYNLPTC